MKFKMPKEGIALLDNYRPAVIALFFLLYANFSNAQGTFQKPTLYGVTQMRQNVDSASFLPTFCGSPTSLRSIDIHKAAMVVDSCNHRLFIYDPKRHSWDSIHIGVAGSGGGPTDTALIRRIISDSINALIASLNTAIVNGDPVNSHDTLVAKPHDPLNDSDIVIKSLYYGDGLEKDTAHSNDSVAAFRFKWQQLRNINQVPHAGFIFNPGDSITYFTDSYGQSNQWPLYLANLTGTVQNNHHSDGATLEKRSPLNWGGGQNLVDNLPNVPVKNTKNKLLVLAFGLNDFRYNGGTYTPANFITDYDSCIKYITTVKKWPASNILVVTPWWNGQAGYTATDISTGNPALTRQRHLDFVAACDTVARHNGTLYLNIFQDQMINDTSAAIMDPDNIHASDSGYKFIARDIYGYLTGNLNLTGVEYANNGLTKSGQTISLEGTLLRNTTIDLGATNYELWLKTAFKSLEDTNKTTQVIIGDADTLPNWHNMTGINEVYNPQRNAALSLIKTKLNNNENGDLFSGGVSNAVGKNGIAIVMFTPSTGVVRPRIYSWSNDVFAGLQFDAWCRDVGNGYMFNVANWDSADLHANIMKPLSNSAAIFKVDNAEVDKFTIYGDGSAKFAGGISTPYTAVSSTYTATTTDYTISCTGTFTLSLPTASGIAGTIYNIINSGTGTLTIDPAGSETINGATTLVGAIQYQTYTLKSNGTNWVLIN